MTIRFDHAILAVQSLNGAIDDFQRLGFTVERGGEHGDGKTHNALIVFADGSYLELLAPVDEQFMNTSETFDMNRFLDYMARGEGWAGFAFYAPDLEAAAAAIAEKGFQVSDLMPNSRLRPDGEVLAWRTFNVESQRAPFFIQDQTPRNLRVSDDPALTRHANGVSGLEALVVAVRKLDKALPRYTAMLGIDPVPGPHIAEAETLAFTLGNMQLVLAAPDDPGSLYNAYIDERGEVPYELWLRTSQPDQAGALNFRKVHRARIQLLN